MDFISRILNIQVPLGCQVASLEVGPHNCAVEICPIILVSIFRHLCEVAVPTVSEICRQGLRVRVGGSRAVNSTAIHGKAFWSHQSARLEAHLEQRLPKTLAARLGAAMCSICRLDTIFTGWIGQRHLSRVHFEIVMVSIVVNRLARSAATARVRVDPTLAPPLPVSSIVLHGFTALGIQPRFGDALFGSDDARSNQVQSLDATHSCTLKAS